MLTVLISIAALIAGAALGFLYGGRKASALAARLEMTEAEAARQRTAHETSLADAKSELSATHREALAAAETRYKESLEAERQRNSEALATADIRHKEALTALETRMGETLRRLQAELQGTTAEMLRQRQKEFSEASGERLGQIVTPLKETIATMKLAMDKNTMQQVSLGTEMKTNIEQMLKQSESAKKSADELARVFKFSTKTQGDWGETVLDELLEANGLTRGIHYDTQPYIRDAKGEAVRSANGTTLRPDIILHLDQTREVIIDSKVSLSAYFDYVNATSEADRQHFLRSHVESVRNHVRELSQKDYSAYIQPPKARMDYVIMFMPHMGALLTALNDQPDLWRRAMESGVFIADEQTLFAALRVVSLTWTQIRQAENHQQVYALANEMLNRVGQFWAEYETMGKALAKASEAYDKGKRKIAEGGLSISTTARQLVKLGAKASQKNPLPLPLDDTPTKGIEQAPQ